MRVNCVVPKFNLKGFACIASNTLYVLDQTCGYLPYMPLSEALERGELEMLVNATKNKINAPQREMKRGVA